MSLVVRSILLGGSALVLGALAACGPSSHASFAGPGAGGVAGGGTSAGSSGGSATGGFDAGGGPLTGVHNSIVATPASNLVSVQVGKKQSVAVTFTSSDGSSIRGFGLTNTTLPAGWTGPAPFGCATVNAGSSCVLNLVYSPTVFETGKSVTLNYVYVDNSGTPATNAQSGASISTSFAYQSTTDDNVTTLVAPGGQIMASIHSGSQPFTVTFATDDGHPASELAVTPAVPLPDMTADGGAGCATVSAGSTCALTWLYQPLAPENGTVTFRYSYLDNSGTAKSGSFNVAYAASANNHVTSRVSPATDPLLVAAAPRRICSSRSPPTTASRLLTSRRSVTCPGWARPIGAGPARDPPCAALPWMPAQAASSC